MFLGSDSNEGDVLLWVEHLNSGLCLRGELSDEGAILDGLVLGHGRSDCNATTVNYNYALHSLVGVYSV